MVVLKHSVCNNTIFLTVPDNFLGHLQDSDFSHISDVSDDAKYDVIYCLFSVKIDDIYA